MSVLFRIALRNVRLGWRQSLASLLSITSGFVAFCLYHGFVEDSARVVGAGYQHVAMLGTVLVQPDRPVETLEELLQARLDVATQRTVESFLSTREAEVRATVRFLNVGGMASSRDGGGVFLGFGFDVDPGALIRGPDFAWNTLGGRPLQESDTPAGVLVGRRLGVALGCEAAPNQETFLPEGGYVAAERAMRCPHPTVRLSGSTADGQATLMQVEVVGVVDAGLRQLEDKLLALPLPMAQELARTEEISLYSLDLAPGVDVGSFVADLKQHAAAAGTPVDVRRWEEHVYYGDLYRRTVELLRIYQLFMVGAVVLIVVMSMTNTVSRAVMERTREIGSMRALGYQRAHITRLIAWEGLLLAVGACLMGLAITVGLTAAVNAAGLYYPEGLASFPIRLRIRFVPEGYALALLVLTAAGTSAAAWPAWKASGMKIADALRHN